MAGFSRRRLGQEDLLVQFRVRDSGFRHDVQCYMGSSLN